MKVELTAEEARVLGSLIEKEITTPDQYPLSLNAIVLACNQKTNRDPVVEYSEAQVQGIIDALQKKHLMFERGGFGSRVPKFQQRLCGTEFSELKLTPQERGVICVLLLRGPQTAGELRTRTNRLCAFADAEETERVLQVLADRVGGALVVRLARAPGEREARFMHLLSGPVPEGAADAAAPMRTRPGAGTTEAGARPGATDPTSGTADLADRVTDIESTLAAIRRELEDLRRRLGD